MVEEISDLNGVLKVIMKFFKFINKDMVLFIDEVDKSLNN